MADILMKRILTDQSICGGCMSFETFEKLPAEKKDLILKAGIREFSVKSFQEAGTDRITKQCGISKGILFHYFGSKKDFYLYCLEKAMERLTEKTEAAEGTDFYEILFAEMDRKIRKCLQYPDEMHLVNMASRDVSAQITQEKTEILRKYREVTRKESLEILNRAMSALDLKNDIKHKITAEGLQIYITAVMNQYLMQYQAEPDAFFENSKKIRKEIREYLDLMLYGICG